MISWATQDVRLHYDYISPSGTTEIRSLPNLPRGEIVHARTHPNQVSEPAILEGITEFFFILDGHAELWRVDGSLEEVTELLPGRCIMMPPGTPFQYTTGRHQLEFLVITAPRWEREKWRQANYGRWSEDEMGRGAAARSDTLPSWTADLRNAICRPSPDGSDICPLLEVDAGGFAHCTLKQGLCSKAVKHNTVDEIWFVLGGRGTIWRMSEDSETATDLLRPGRCITIPVGTSFQFKSEGNSPLRIGIGTFPKWPGESEAQLVVGPW